VDGKVYTAAKVGFTFKTQQNGDIIGFGDNTHDDIWGEQHFGGVITVLKFDHSGAVETEFGSNTGNGGKISFSVDDSIGKVTDLTTDALGRLLVLGQKDLNSQSGLVLFRYHRNGQPDTSFGSNGVITTDLAIDFYANNVITDSNGHIIVAAADGEQTVVYRFDDNGQIDHRFVGNGTATFDQFPGDYAYASPTDLALDDQGYLYLATTIALRSRLLKMHSGYPSATNRYFASILINQDSNPDPALEMAQAIAVEHFAFNSLQEAQLNQITLSAIPHEGQLFIDANSNGIKDQTEAALAVDDVMSKTQLNTGQLSYQPGNALYSQFEYRINESGETETVRLLLNPAPQTSIMVVDDTNVDDDLLPIQVHFNELVYGFSASQINVTNGTVTEFSGNGSDYTMMVQLQSTAPVTVDIPHNAAVDYNGAGSTAALLVLQVQEVVVEPPSKPQTENSSGGSGGGSLNFGLGLMMLLSFFRLEHRMILLRNKLNNHRLKSVG
jgi:hypothetical protein